MTPSKEAKNDAIERRKKKTTSKATTKMTTSKEAKRRRRMLRKNDNVESDEKRRPRNYESHERNNHVESDEGNGEKNDDVWRDKKQRRRKWRKQRTFVAFDVIAFSSISTSSFLSMMIDRIPPVVYWLLANDFKTKTVINTTQSAFNIGGGTVNWIDVDGTDGAAPGKVWIEIAIARGARASQVRMFNVKLLVIGWVWAAPSRWMKMN